MRVDPKTRPARLGVFHTFVKHAARQPVAGYPVNGGVGRIALPRAVDDSIGRVGTGLQHKRAVYGFSVRHGAKGSGCDIFKQYFAGGIVSRPLGGIAAAVHELPRGAIDSLQCVKVG